MPTTMAMTDNEIPESNSDEHSKRYQSWHTLKESSRRAIHFVDPLCTRTDYVGTIMMNLVHNIAASCETLFPVASPDSRTANRPRRGFYLISSSFKSKVSSEFAGIPGRDFPPYARWAGTVIRRSPPTAKPATPISIPLIASPRPRVNVKGLPFLLARSVVSTTQMLTPKLT